MPPKPAPKPAVKGKAKAGASKGGEKKDEPVKPVDPRDPHGLLAWEFDRLDRNGDTFVDQNEFHHGLLTAGWDQNEVSTLFEKINISHDGKITKEEFLNYRAGQDKPMVLDPKTVFAEYDKDKDDALNLRELARLVRKVEDDEGFLGVRELGPYVKEQLAEGDKDGDQKLNFAEFTAWFDGFIRHVEDVRAKFEAEQAARKAARAKAEEPPKPKFEGDGIWDCDMKDVPVALEEAYNKKKTPLLIDDTADDRESLNPTPMETFLLYGNNNLLEMKKMSVEVNIRKDKPLETAMEEARDKVVKAIKYGNTLCFLLANACPPIKSKFNSPESLPLELFDCEQVLAVAGSGHLKWFEKVLRPGEDVKAVSEKFRVLVMTKFTVEDYAGYLQDDVPLELCQHIHVTNRKGR
eukprot:CAMPEP_0181328256 /NCGR_PEP_ID=MMETSP1101-20121128/22601_1 /TAXON_ID=46948 /ORGANISM="Rhodomonas abbreviata, Strain Caron Lab Isolate" /LENGTH=406 /DNA_ID=CAMNT_0023437097 /DNA_START=10 /DNA_END=1230 /DNA_ORIENTATION=-